MVIAKVRTSESVACPQPTPPDDLDPSPTSASNLAHCWHIEAQFLLSYTWIEGRREARQAGAGQGVSMSGGNCSEDYEYDIVD